MDSSDLRIWAVIVAVAVVIFTVWYKRRKDLEQHLLQCGVEKKATIEKRGTMWGGLRDVRLKYEVSGQTYYKVLSIDSSVADEKEIPILVDPVNPSKVLFNIKKFDLQPVSEDSLQNFLEREKNYGEEEDPHSDIEADAHYFTVYEDEGYVVAEIHFAVNLGLQESRIKEFFEELIAMVATDCKDCIRRDSLINDNQMIIFANGDYEKLEEACFKLEEQLQEQRIAGGLSPIKTSEQIELESLEEKMEQCWRIVLTLCLKEPLDIDIECKIYSLKDLKQIIQKAANKTGIDLSFVKE